MILFQTLKKPWFYLSLLLGGVFGLFIYGYWLIDIFPPMSKSIFAYTGFTSITAAVGYFFLLEKWLLPRISEMTKTFRWKFVILSVVCGIFLMAVGTEAWEAQFRFLVFLLPSQSLEIIVPPQSQLPDSRVGISLLRTSVADEVSLDTIHYQGWKKINDALVLQDWSNNSLIWKGKTGEGAVIVFQANSPDIKVKISWNGVTEDIVLDPSKGGKDYYSHGFDASGYASRGMVLFLGVVNFTLIAALVISFVRYKRQILAGKFSESFTHQPIKKEHQILEIGIVVCLILASLLLRVFNLEAIPPYRDEYIQIRAAENVADGLAIDTAYQRSFWIVTLPVAHAFEMFGYKLWVARLVGVLFNALAIIPLFLIARRINIPVAIISGMLFATSPWIIAVSRSVREYAYYPFYYYWIVYGLVVMIERFPKHFSLTSDIRKLINARFLIPLFILLLPVYYGLVLDWSSTFVLILGAYGVFLLFIFMKFDFRDKITVWLLVVVGVVALVEASLILMRYSSRGTINSLSLFFTDSFFSNSLTLTPLKIFFSNPVQQWYYDRVALTIALALGSAIIASLFLYRVNFIPLFVLVLFLLQVAFFVFFFQRYFRPRYMVSAQLWYVVVLAIGIYSIWLVVSVLFKKNKAFLIALALIAVTFNVGQVLLPSSATVVTTPMPITDEYHPNTKAANDFLFGKVMQGDVLISTYYAAYIHLVEGPVFSKIYSYGYRNNANDYIASIIKKHDSGWIVMDDVTSMGEKELPREAFIIADRKAEFLGKFGDQVIWKWYVSK